MKVKKYWKKQLIIYWTKVYLLPKTHKDKMPSGSLKFIPDNSDYCLVFSHLKKSNLCEK